MLCETKAALHFTTDDAAGGDQECDQVVAIVERLVEQEGRLELSSNLANAYASKSIAVGALGDNLGAADLCGRAIAIQEALVYHAGSYLLRRPMTSSERIFPGPNRTIGSRPR